MVESEAMVVAPKFHKTAKDDHRIDYRRQGCPRQGRCVAHIAHKRAKGCVLARIRLASDRRVGFFAQPHALQQEG